MRGWVEVLAGQPAAAEPELRKGADRLREIGESSWFSTVAGILAEALYRQGRDEEAEEFARASEEAAGIDDAYAQGLLRSIRARVLSRRGEAERAVELARDAVAILEPTDFLFLQGFTRLALGQVLLETDRMDEARTALEEAARICEVKGFTVGVLEARALLGRVRVPGSRTRRG